MHPAHDDAGPAKSHEEIELKWALDPAAHAALAGHLERELGPPQILEQVNRFFDTADRRLRTARMNLRLRRENGRVLLTCKQKAADAPLGLVDGLARHAEWECWLDPELAAGIDHPTPAWTAALPLPEIVRRALGDAPVAALGGFANRRLEFDARRDGLAELLCLDRTDYGVRIDHELEIETSNPALTAAWWQQRLAAWGIAYQPQETTKFARFLALGQG